MNYFARARRGVVIIVAFLCGRAASIAERVCPPVCAAREPIARLARIMMAVSICVAATSARPDETVKTMDLQGSGSVLMIGAGSMIMLPWRNVTLEELRTPVKEEIDDAPIQTWRFLLLTAYMTGEPASPFGDESLQ